MMIVYSPLKSNPGPATAACMLLVMGARAKYYCNSTWYYNSFTILHTTSQR